jgi:hypothetical protein
MIWQLFHLPKLGLWKLFLFLFISNCFKHQFSADTEKTLLVANYSDTLPAGSFVSNVRKRACGR